MSDPTQTAVTAVTVSLISTLGVVLSAVVAWLMNITVRDRASAQEDKLAALQSELRTAEERLRGTLARDLAAHESALRVTGEIELRLISQAGDALTQCVQTLARGYDCMLTLSAGVMTGRTTDSTMIDTIQKELVQSGVFLPPELDQAYMQAAEAIGVGIVEIFESQRMSDEQRHKLHEEIKLNSARLMFGFREKAGLWKAEAWKRVRTTPGADPR